jgi:hypothetical protein
MGLVVVGLFAVGSPGAVDGPGAVEEGWERVEATSLLSYALRLRRDMVDRLQEGKGEDQMKRSSRGHTVSDASD